MIFRKPYAILIKNFKLIHTLITFCMVYLLYRGYLIYSYIQEFMQTTMLAVREDITAEFFSSWMFILPGIIIVGLLIILAVMIKKEKPFMFYIINILIYGLTIGVYVYTYNTLDYIEINIIESKDIKLCSDILFMLLSAQSISLILTSIRAFGFDVKKFDFGKDLVELEVSEEDAEEFEVSVNVETNVIKREFNKKLRYAKYAYLENKFLINTAVLVLLSLTFYLIYINSNIYNVNYKQGTTFRVSGFELSVTKSMITQKKYNDKIVTSNDKIYVAVELNIRAFEKWSKLNTALTLLEIDGKNYYPIDLEDDNDVLDLGVTYFYESIDIDFEKIILVYEVPSSLKEEKMVFKYLNNLNESNNKDNPKYIRINLDPLHLDEKEEEIEVSIGNPLVLNEDLLGTTSITINSFEIKKEFVASYNFCVESECYKSTEYIRAPLNTINDQMILKVNASLEKDESITFGELRTAYDVLNYYGYIVYKVGEKSYKTTYGFTEVVPTKFENKKNFYISISDSVNDAEEVYLYLNVRNKVYKYKIK